ncbi:MAG: hypothetical protein COT38_04725 [Candidatus Omnitrophica bacterium CG08_land_8_20_14_0_20_41_16]|uniref:Formylmethanofuran dehydrogenase subunit E domain-containing protein n=1 Tax=Candidatus Sherwoodlollariibacterium unditelluris TaxID=1974757 RepID=A0A2G9YJJ5_9BACT|nr:MAG: hypothetical protein COX41_05740 [Candidatus Omnitrophica bacterium CG23_combo_of_CG06-09_8_20_14_all_41_10]PIS33550.1 MAG: hypothetical protein COT38_04725 [Candidatus Omnitrophica bacterium CG08_land_8_20_14_0_20_41_16]
MRDRISLKEAIKFHGHLGPYLVLGIRAGELALKKLKCKKYFGLEVEIYGVEEKPKSCLIDGLQLSTGATFGKGNICKIKAKNIKIIARNLKNNKEVTISFRPSLIKDLSSLKNHRDSEAFAQKLLRINTKDLFQVKTKSVVT